MKTINHYLSLIFQKTYADLVSEARRGYLGILWWVIEPILYLSAFYVIFVVLFNKRGDGAVTFLLTGLVVWKWFDSSVRMSANSISLNAGLIQQVYIPKIVFPSMVMMSCFIKFLIIFPILIIFLMIVGKGPSLVWIAIPILIITQILLMYFIGSALAAIIPFAPDFRLIIDNGMTLLFFMSGIFFDISTASPKIKTYLYLNPMVGLIENYRLVLLDRSWPDWASLGLISFISIVGIIAVWTFLKRFDRIYAKII